MQYTPKLSLVQLASVRLHALVVLSILVLALIGQMPDSQAGWIACPPQVVRGTLGWRPRRCGHPERPGFCHDEERWWWLLHTCSISLLRSLILWALWQFSGQVGPAWVWMMPWELWLWQSAGLLWPWLRRQPEWRGVSWLLWQGQRLLMVGYLGRGWVKLFQWAGEASCRLSAPGSAPLMLGLGCALCGREEPGMETVRREDGSYQATLCGHFTLQVSGDHPFRARLLMLFLRLLPVLARGSAWASARRTPHPGWTPPLRHPGAAGELV